MISAPALIILFPAKNEEEEKQQFRCLQAFYPHGMKSMEYESYIESTHKTTTLTPLMVKKKQKKNQKY